MKLSVSQRTLVSLDAPQLAALLVCALRHLAKLDVSDNRLTGALPSCVASLSHAHLYDNEFWYSEASVALRLLIHLEEEGPAAGGAAAAAGPAPSCPPAGSARAAFATV